MENDRYELKNIDGSNRTLKYSHENLRAVPRGFEGLVDIASTMNNDEAETAARGREDENEVLSDDNSDTLSVASSHTMTASSATLSVSELDES